MEEPMEAQGIPEPAEAEEAEMWEVSCSLAPPHLAPGTMRLGGG
jgi:hypothetical protein